MVKQPPLISTLIVYSIIAEYEPRDIFNLDETGLFYNQVVKRTYAKEHISGTKIKKERITVVLMCNADGSLKFDPVFIGKAEKPRCFKKKTGMYCLLTTQFQG